MLFSRSLLVIHFKYSSVYMSFPNLLTTEWSYRWNPKKKKIQMNLFTNQKQTHRLKRTNVWLPGWKGTGEGQLRTVCYWFTAASLPWHHAWHPGYSLQCDTGMDLQMARTVRRLPAAACLPAGQLALLLQDFPLSRCAKLLWTTATSSDLPSFRGC